jgi:hypothetical protein
VIAYADDICYINSDACINNLKINCQKDLDRLNLSFLSMGLLINSFFFFFFWFVYRQPIYSSKKVGSTNIQQEIITKNNKGAGTRRPPNAIRQGGQSVQLSTK